LSSSSEFAASALMSRTIAAIRDRPTVSIGRSA